MDVKDITPIECVDGVYVKRDDKFVVFNSHGGKARSALQIISNGISNGYKEFVTAGSRLSPQCEIVSDICENLSVNCHLFMPKGQETSVIKNIEKNHLSYIHRTKVGYNNVICKWATDYADTNTYYYIPFGMECVENIEITKHQVINIPAHINRIIIPVGSGMSFISVCNGLEFYNKHHIEVVGISVGKSPQKNIQKYINASHIKYNIIKSEYDYHCSLKQRVLGDIELDEIYEAKCLEYLNKGDLFWIVGKRN